MEMARNQHRQRQQTQKNQSQHRNQPALRIGSSVGAKYLRNVGLFARRREGPAARNPRSRLRIGRNPKGWADAENLPASPNKKAGFCRPYVLPY